MELDEEINNAEKKIEENFEIIKDLMKISYEQKLGGYLGLLLESKDFGNFIRRLEVVSSLIKNNDRIIIETTELQNALEEKKNIVLNRKKQLEDKKEEIIKEKSNLEQLLIEKEEKVKKLVDIQIELEKEVLLSEYQIKSLEEQGRVLEEEILKALKDSMKDYLGGVMVWPVPGYIKISSPYGNRVHPITGVHKLHTGIDIPAPAGTPVKAANSGVVIMSKMDRAYGNVVAIDHGGGIATLYAHNSKLLVNVGDKVIKGQTIAQVGTTGYSTGNHCHFEVKIDGKTVDPMPFLEEK
ncbi:peptidoglycan DD-metalloendopeptidase family protein [Clostridium tarantellae]|uniref:Peptidoglycan DD-metalloendopeptidase family protein n=2 Tax=Clostridium tarantellae TaxID=39493 RepID=A0A6I1MQW9_9CLOT|nr:peptidoglycan DD-metalloendopeptidase family protein [Clostridium tarantellae]